VVNREDILSDGVDRQRKEAARMFWIHRSMIHSPEPLGVPDPYV
jgi:hypothetical protein